MRTLFIAFLLIVSIACAAGAGYLVGLYQGRTEHTKTCEALDA